jgi:3D (Asp-Asp-Asp) domain-containing protein
MLLSRSTGRKVVATVVAALAFTCLYEVTTLDSRRVLGEAEVSAATEKPAPGSHMRFSISAYCKGKTTASGVNVRSGIAASDPDLLPVGSVVQIGGLSPKYDGIYTIMDTGPAVQGRRLDLYMWSCNEALELGRRIAAVTVMRLGWNPRATAPRLLDRLRHPLQRQPPTETPPARAPETQQSR